MNSDEHDFLAVIAEADPHGEGGAWLLSVGQPVVGGFLRRFLQRQVGLNGVTRVTSLRMRWYDRTYDRSRREVRFATMTAIRKR